MRNRLPSLALVGTVLVLWELYVRAAAVDPVVLPGPVRIVAALVQYRGDAVRHTIPTLLETVLGFAIAVGLAVTAAIASATTLDQLHDLVEATRLTLDENSLELLDVASAYQSPPVRKAG